MFALIYDVLVDCYIGAARSISLHSEVSQLCEAFAFKERRLNLTIRVKARLFRVTKMTIDFDKIHQRPAHADGHTVIAYKKDGAQVS